MGVEDLEQYESEIELALYREYRDVVRLFRYVVETERRFYLANDADVRVKATDGGDHLDPMFRKNWRDASEAGLKRGAYHFFTLCRPGAVQAAHFIATAPREAGALQLSVARVNEDRTREAADERSKS